MIDVATTTVNLENNRQTKMDRYIELMGHAEKNSSEDKPKYLHYVAALQNRSAADIARELNEPKFQNLAANKSYEGLMALKPDEEWDGTEGNFLYTSEYTGGGSVRMYKIYEAAALVAEKNNLGDGKRLSAARKAVTTLIDEVKADMPEPRSHYAFRYLSCDAVEELSEARRIAKRFELTDLQKELEGLKDDYIRAAQQQLESLIRKDYQNPI